MNNTNTQHKFDFDKMFVNQKILNQYKCNGIYGYLFQYI